MHYGGDDKCKNSRESILVEKGENIYKKMKKTEQENISQLNYKTFEQSYSLEHIIKTASILGKSARYYLSEVNETLEIVRKATASAIEVFNSIDWTHVRKALREKYKYYETFSSSFAKECWALDIDLLIALEDEECKPHEIENYVEKNLDNYLEYFKKDPLYIKHTSLIIETFELYKMGHYKHCVFSLFAVSENILDVLFTDYKIDKEVDILFNKKKRKKRYLSLFDKIENFYLSNEEEVALEMIFFRRVFNVYNILFMPEHEEHPQQLNRHWIAHGKYDYDTITKEDVLKLIQLLKAASILNDITIENK